MASVSLRACVGCGAIRPKAELVRVQVSPDGGVDVDIGGGARGGADACPTRSCLERAMRSPACTRGLDVAPAPADVTILEGLIRERVSCKVVSLLGLARRARKLVSGAEAVESAVKRGRARVILTATDASAGSVDQIRARALSAGTVCYRLLSKEELGAAVGGAPRSCVALTDPHFSEALRSVLAKCPPDAASAGPRPDLAMRPLGQTATRESWR